MADDTAPLKGSPPAIPVDDAMLAQHPTNIIDKKERLKTQIVANLTAVSDYADRTFLPAFYNVLEAELRLDPITLGVITSSRSVLAALGIPLWGWMADRYSRRKLLAWGCVFWGLSMVLVGLSWEFWSLLVFRSLNGFGLGIVLPAVMSLVTDYFRVSERGRAFGYVSFCGVIGGGAGAAYAAAVANEPVLGMSGWRFACFSFALFSVLLGVLVWFVAVDPRRGASDLEEANEKYLVAYAAGEVESDLDRATPININSDDVALDESPGSGSRRPDASSDNSDVREDYGACDDPAPTEQPDGTVYQNPPPPETGSKAGKWIRGKMGSLKAAHPKLFGRGNRAREIRLRLIAKLYQPKSWSEEWQCWKQILQRPTAVVLMCTTALFGLPFSGFNFIILYLEYAGFQPVVASLVLAILGLGSALGMLSSGYLSDRMAKLLGFKGRVAMAQFSSWAGLPLVYVLVHVLPASQDYLISYCVVACAAAFLSSWSLSSAVGPLMSEVTLPLVRSRAYAITSVVDGSIGSLGSVILGAMAQGWFGYVVHEGVEIPDLPAWEQEVNRDALGSALFWMTAVCWGLMGFVYFIVYLTYPRDHAWLQEKLTDFRQYEGMAAGDEIGGGGDGGEPYHVL